MLSTTEIEVDLGTNAVADDWQLFRDTAGKTIQVNDNIDFNSGTTVDFTGVTVTGLPEETRFTAAGTGAADTELTSITFPMANIIRFSDGTTNRDIDISNERVERGAAFPGSPTMGDLFILTMRIAGPPTLRNLVSTSMMVLTGSK